VNAPWHIPKGSASKSTAKAGESKTSHESLLRGFRALARGRALCCSQAGRAEERSNYRRFVLTLLSDFSTSPSYASFEQKFPEG